MDKGSKWPIDPECYAMLDQNQRQYWAQLELGAD